MNTAFIREKYRDVGTSAEFYRSPAYNLIALLAALGFVVIVGASFIGAGVAGYKGSEYVLADRLDWEVFGFDLDVLLFAYIAFNLAAFAAVAAGQILDKTWRGPTL